MWGGEWSTASPRIHAQTCQDYPRGGAFGRLSEVAHQRMLPPTPPHSTAVAKRPSAAPATGQAARAASWALGAGACARLARPTSFRSHRRERARATDLYVRRARRRRRCVDCGRHVLRDMVVQGRLWGSLRGGRCRGLLHVLLVVDGRVPARRRRAHEADVHDPVDRVPPPLRPLRPHGVGRLEVADCAQRPPRHAFSGEVARASARAVRLRHHRPRCGGGKWWSRRAPAGWGGANEAVATAAAASIPHPSSPPRERARASSRKRACLLALFYGRCAGGAAHRRSTTRAYTRAGCAAPACTR